MLAPLKAFGSPALDRCEPTLVPRAPAVAQPVVPARLVVLRPVLRRRRTQRRRHRRRQPITGTHQLAVSSLALWQMGGAVARVADDATAFSGRGAGFTFNINGNTETAGRLRRATPVGARLLVGAGAVPHGRLRQLPHGGRRSPRPAGLRRREVRTAQRLQAEVRPDELIPAQPEHPTGLTSQTKRVPAVAVVGTNQHLPSRAPGAGATTIGATGTVSWHCRLQRARVRADENPPRHRLRSRSAATWRRKRRNSWWRSITGAGAHLQGGEDGARGDQAVGAQPIIRKVAPALPPSAQAAVSARCGEIAGTASGTDGRRRAPSSDGGIEAALGESAQPPPPPQGVDHVRLLRHRLVPPLEAFGAESASPVRRCGCPSSARAIARRRLSSSVGRAGDSSARTWRCVLVCATSSGVGVNRLCVVVVLGSRGHVPHLGGRRGGGAGHRGLRRRRIRVACSARTGEMGACRTASDFRWVSDFSG